MAFKTAVWAVHGSTLQAQDQIVLDSEKRLEDWIAVDLSLLGEELLLLGRQVRASSGPLDLLAIDGDGSLVIVELKKNRTPREVVAQILDYASWVREQTAHDIDELCQKLHRRSLAEMFRSRFEYDLPEGACKSHRMVVVAAQLDDSSERIIRYLQEEHEININAVFFSVYRVGVQEMLVRAWFADPIETQERAERREQVPWSGIWFVNNGVDDRPNNKRDWELCRRYGFISAGGGEKYSQPLYKLSAGDTIAAYQKRGRHGRGGYVGVGTVSKTAVPASEFVIKDGRPLSAIATPGIVSHDHVNGEHVVGIDWVKTVPETEAKTFDGVFANQNVVCKLRHGPTLEFIRRQFGLTAEQPS
jgi:hypothetical protein